jgi:hypothetical protein
LHETKASKKDRTEGERKSAQTDREIAKSIDDDREKKDQTQNPRLTGSVDKCPKNDMARSKRTDGVGGNILPIHICSRRILKTVYRENRLLTIILSPSARKLSILYLKKKLDSIIEKRRAIRLHGFL